MTRRESSDAGLHGLVGAADGVVLLEVADVHQFAIYFALLDLA